MAALDAPRVAEMPMDEEGFVHEGDGVRVVRRGENATVDFAPGASRVSQDDSDEHSKNLVDDLGDHEATALALKIIEYVQADIDSRKDWQKRMDQAVELMGLANVPMEELAFDGASAVTYPLIAEAVVQFQARAIEEIFPSDGPVKVKVVGRLDSEREAQAERVKNHMNYQMLDQDRSYFWNTDQMLFYLPLGGSAFKKTYFDPVAKMTVSRFVQSADFIVPYVASDLASAPRYTHRMVKTDQQMKKLFASGFYKEVDLIKTPWGSEDADEARKTIDIGDSRSQSTADDDNRNTLYECHIDLELDFDQDKAGGIPLPYIVTVLKENQQIVGVRRNWKESDETFSKRIWFTHYRYLPGFGFYGFGLLHMIGSLAEATSASVRALLDSATFANMQGGYVSSDAKMKPGDNHISPGVYKEVNMSAEELSRAFYTPPFKDPSSALASLVESLVGAGKSFTSTTEAMTGEGSNTGPVGTTIAMIEQGSKVFSGIHRRLHMAAAEEFALRAELNYEFLPDEYPYEVESEEQSVLRNDYDGRVDVIPVSDPNIFSTAQRIAQGQALVQLAMENPDLYNRRKVHERFLKAIRAPNPEELLVEEQSPTRRDPVTENAYLLVNTPFQAFPDQDHDSHIAVHMNFIQGLNEEALQEAGPVMQAHIAQHYAYKYYNMMNQAAGGQFPPLDLSGSPDGELPPEADAMMAQFAAQQPPIQLMPPTEGSPSAEDEAKAAAIQAEEARKQAAFEAEQQRAQQQHELDLVRSQETHEAELAMKAEQANIKIEGDRAASRIKLEGMQASNAEKAAAAKAAKAKARSTKGGKR